MTLRETRDLLVAVCLTLFLAVIALLVMSDVHAKANKVMDAINTAYNG